MILLPDNNDGQVDARDVNGYHNLNSVDFETFCLSVGQRGGGIARVGVGGCRWFDTLYLPLMTRAVVVCCWSTTDESVHEHWADARGIVGLCHWLAILCYISDKMTLFIAKRHCNIYIYIYIYRSMKHTMTCVHLYVGTTLVCLSHGWRTQSYTTLTYGCLYNVYGNRLV